MAMNSSKNIFRAVAGLFLLASLACFAVLAAWAARGHGPFASGVLSHVSVWCLGVVGGFSAWIILRRAGEPGAIRRAFARLVLVLVSVALSFAVAEWGLRRVLVRALDAGSFAKFKELKERGAKIHVHSASPLATIITPSDDPKLVYELERNLNTNFGNHRLVINADGQREDRVYAKERSPGTVRILGLGDSGMFGWGVEQGDDYLGVMERTLNARGDGTTYEAINTGTPGYNTQLELELLKARGLAYRPDIVVIGWCENDFFLPHFFLKRNELPKSRLLLWDFLFHRELFRKELQPSEIADRETAKNAIGKVDMENVPDELKTGLYEEGVRAALEEMKRMSGEQGFKLLVFGPLKQDVLDIVQSLGIEHVNTLEKIRIEDHPLEWAVHAMHPRTEGHRVLGELLAGELAARDWLKPASPQALAGSPPP
jgi:hypothetical protein